MHETVTNNIHTQNNNLWTIESVQEEVRIIKHGAGILSTAKPLHDLWCRIYYGYTRYGYLRLFSISFITNNVLNVKKFQNYKWK